MKKFIITSLISLLSGVAGLACGPMEPVHNFYMFNVYSHGNNNPFSSRVADYWKVYTGEKRTNEQIRSTYYQTPSEYYFSDNCKRIFAVAKRKKDTEMTVYIHHLINYSKICDQLKETWDYPTKKQLAARMLTLQNMKNAAKTYRGKRLKQQYALLYMRANMLTGNYNANSLYWNNTASKYNAGIYRDIMQNIYANALLHKGLWRQACDIYSSQYDWESIEWAMRKYRNMAGIRNIYATDPNSPTLNYLVQNFVNSAQETIDTDGNQDYINVLGKTPVFEKDIKDFIAFANNAASTDKINNKCLWKSASAMLNYLIGNNKEAMDEINKAMNLNGDERTKDNARCIRLLVSTVNNDLNSSYTTYLAKEFGWLQKKRNSDDKFYSNVMNRVVFRNLAPKYSASGHPEVSTALIGMMNEIENHSDAYNSDQHSTTFDWNKKENYNYNNDYYGEYFDQLDSMSADAMAKYFTYIESTPKDAFESFVLKNVYKNEDFFHDLIGTKYLAEGKFADAIPYLKKVHLSFLSHQNICYYMAHRDFTQARWFKHQLFNENAQTDGYGLATLKENPKLKFCEQMLQMQSRYTLAREDNARRQAAYDLASRYYQASCYGDCWFLSRYAHSCMDSARTFQMDFAQKAMEYLKDSRQSTDMKLQQQSLYARAYIQFHFNSFYCVFDYPTTYPYIKARPEVYAAYTELSDFVRHNQSTDTYITKCDVLKKFMDGPK